MELLSKLEIFISKNYLLFQLSIGDHYVEWPLDVIIPQRGKAHKQSQSISEYFDSIC